MKNLMKNEITKILGSNCSCFCSKGPYRDQRLIGSRTNGIECGKSCKRQDYSMSVCII